VFTDALGRRIEAAPRTTGSTQAIVAEHAREGPAIAPHTATGRWAGEDLDLGLAVAVLCASRSARAGPSVRPVSAAPSG
ncbi:MAG: hypothetical protein ACK54X_22880, partial [Burkholderiales bacterium]